MKTQSIAPLVDQFLASYEKCGTIHHLNGVAFPSKTSVDQLVQMGLQILFPGFFTEQPIASSDLPSMVASWLKDFRKKLVKEIDKSVRVRGAGTMQGVEEVVKRFLESLPAVRSVLQTDVQAAYEGDPAAGTTDEVTLAYPGIEAVAVQRMAHLLYREKVALLPRMMTEWAHGRTGIDIHAGAQIGDHFFIDHGTGVVIGETCEIGAHVRIYQGVTLGGKSLAKQVERDAAGMALNGKRHPTIQQGVTIYANATILGGETVIGENSIIGGNVWLTHSVPPGSIVSLESQQIKIRSRQPRQTPNWEI